MQQSDTAPREAPKVQGKRTREQNRRIIDKDENTKGADVPLPGETLQQAGTRYPGPRPGSAGEIATGERSIQRGAHDESTHRKRRTDGQ
jgi:hypothetical protein